MGNTLSKKIFRSLFAAAVGVALLGGNAYADEVTDLLMQGKDYLAARSATHVTATYPYSSAALVAARAHAREMSVGKDHYAAIVTAARLNEPGVASPDVSKEHIRAMSLGKDHWDAIRRR